MMKKPSKSAMERIRKSILSASDLHGLNEALIAGSRAVLGRSHLALWTCVSDPLHPGTLLPAGQRIPERGRAAPPMKPHEAVQRIGKSRKPRALSHADIRGGRRKVSSHGRRVNDLRNRQGLLLFPFWLESRLVGFCMIKIGRSAAESPDQTCDRLQEAFETAPYIMDKLAAIEAAVGQLGEVRTVLDVGSDLFSMKSREQVLQSVAEAAVARLGYSGALTALKDDDGKSLIISAAHGMASARKGDVLPLDLSSRRWSGLKHGRPIWIDRKEAGAFPQLQGQPLPSQAAVVIPLQIKNELQGVILARPPRRPQSGVSVHGEALRVFAKTAGQALENARLYSEVEHAAETDALTGIYNRFHFERALKREVTRMQRYHHPVSLLMIDIVGFKAINDTLGHLAGDEILKEAAELLTENVREPDTVARFGGDEFVVLMPNTNESQARLVQERIEEAVAERNASIPDKSLQFALSIGLNSASDFNAQQLIDEADRAMYQNKDVHIRKRMLEALVAENDRELENIDKTVASVLKVLQEKEDFYFSHARRVMHYAVKICQMLNMESDVIETVALGALLHDVGKVAIHVEILNKPEALSSQEYDIIRTHPALGGDLLSGIERLRDVRNLIRSHHERYDGKTDGKFPGYPEGIKGDAILREARVLKLADTYDALTTNRPYRQAMSANEAMAVLNEERGASLDPELVDLFVPYLKTTTRPLSQTFAIG